MGLQSINMKPCMATWIISMSLAMLLINPVVVCTDPEEDAYMRLKDYVFNQPRIKYKMPPDIQNRGPVYFAFLPFQIASADEVDQTVTLTTLIYMEWTLPNIGWNASDYGDLKEISVGQDEIWTPSIMAPKSKGNHIVEMPDVLIISNQGAVKAKKLTTMTTFCTIDLFNLPFDEHTCALPFIETSEYVLQAFPNPELFRMISQKFSSSAEWIITDTGCSMDLFQPNISNAGVGSKLTECCFTMKRQSAYYVNLLISPVIIMALMARVVFCIPAESGEKISLIVSLFVAMTVFLVILTDITPRSMQRQPRVMTFVVSVVIEIVCITFATAYVLQRYHRDCNTKNVIKDGVSQPQSANKATNQTTLNQVADDGSVEASVAGVAYNTHNGRGGKRHGLCSHLSKLMVDVFSGKDLTHRQLDTLFFIFFLVSGVVVYTMVLSI